MHCPALAVSPILGRLSAIFPHSTELDIQMLSSLPSLLIIPFIILSGKLTEKINNVLLLQVGLVIFSLSGILYMLSTKMWQLITVSALLGIGSGLIVPLSTGLISRFFTGHTVRNSSGSVPPYEYNVSAGHRSDGVSGRGELAFAVCRLPVSADLDRSLVLSEKEYFTVSRYRYKHH